MDKNQILDFIPDMIQQAKHARTRAYAPYSNYTVGAALLTMDDVIITGCNVENAAYSPGNCAERTAVFKAVSEGYRQFKAIAIVAGEAALEGTEAYPSPCGGCRQVLREFVNPKDFMIVLAKSVEDYKLFTLEELLPISFGPEYLN